MICMMKRPKYMPSEKKIKMREKEALPIEDDIKYLENKEYSILKGYYCSEN